MPLAKKIQGGLVYTILFKTVYVQNESICLIDVTLSVFWNDPMLYATSLGRID